MIKKNADENVAVSGVKFYVWSYLRRFYFWSQSGVYFIFGSGQCIAGLGGVV